MPTIDAENYQHILKPSVITSKPGKNIIIDGKLCLNLVTHNYLGLADDTRLEEASLAAVKKYGVGSCGPRGFYGTMDVHLNLEEELAKFLQLEEAVLYSFGFTTIASAIPAYAKANDIVYVDEYCNFAIQQGLNASRSKIVKFEHNNPRDLERLIELENDDRNKDRAGNKVRSFIVVESIYFKTGELCPLKEIVDIKRKHKIRLFIDESRSFAVIGHNGKGICEHLNLDINDIDLIMVSLETALCGYGGFCAGTSFVVDHQRLAGTGYCFSASLPPLQTQVALESLKIIQKEPNIIHDAQEKYKYASERLKSLTKLKDISDPIAPFKVLVFREFYNNIRSVEQVLDDEKRLDKICKEIFSHESIAISVARNMVEEEMTTPFASIRFIVNAAVTTSDIDGVVKALEKYSNSC